MQYLIYLIFNLVIANPSISGKHFDAILGPHQPNQNSSLILLYKDAVYITCTTIKPGIFNYRLLPNTATNKLSITTRKYQSPHTMLHNVSSESAVYEPKYNLKYKDILVFNTLKHQQNESLQIIASCFNNSYGIAMKPPFRIKNNHTVEVRVESIGNDTIQAGIKKKYVKMKIPNIYLYNAENIDPGPLINSYDTSRVTLIPVMRDWYRITGRGIETAEMTELTKAYMWCGQAFVGKTRQKLIQDIAMTFQVIPCGVLLSIKDELPTLGGPGIKLQRFYTDSPDKLPDNDEINMVRRELGPGAEQILEQTMGEMLNVKKDKNKRFWNKFQELVMKCIRQKMEQNLRCTPFKYGSGITLDILHTYHINCGMHRFFSRNARSSRNDSVVYKDLHVIIPDNNDWLNIDVQNIIRELSRFLPSKVASNVLKLVEVSPYGDY